LPERRKRERSGVLLQFAKLQVAYKEEREGARFKKDGGVN